jgi:hypothetical protein
MDKPSASGVNAPRDYDRQPRLGAAEFVRVKLNFTVNKGIFHWIEILIDRSSQLAGTSNQARTTNHPADFVVLSCHRAIG